MRRNDFVLGGDNPWEEVFPEFTKQISQKMEKDLYATMALQFSTSTIRETTAFEIAFMDAMSNYFDYEFISLCGIPEIHIKGTVGDYTKILTSLETLRGYRLDWWIDQLYPIIETIIETLQGENHTSFWTSIYKQESESGGPYITGWITNFFPYLSKRMVEQDGVIQYDDTLKEGQILKIIKKENFDFIGKGSKIIKVIVQNPVFDPNSKFQLKLDDFSNGLSTVPFKWTYLDQELDMHFMSGFIGIKEDTSTHTLSTDIHWAITI